LPRRSTGACAAALVVVLLGLVGGCGGSGGPDGSGSPHGSATGEGSSTPSPDGPVRFHTYVALGDSYTAAPLVPSTRGDDGCFRSTHNYPSLVADALHVPDFRDRSCGGATTADLTTPQRADVPAQLDAVDGDTDLVTLSMGGNDDAVFGRLVVQCARLGPQDPTGAPCTDAAASGSGDLDRIMGGVQRRLTGALHEIGQRAPRATVLVVGYPRIFPAQGTCPDLPFAKGDYPFALRVNRRLDDALRAAARAAGVRFVDVWRPSIGHDICSATPWINGAQTLLDQAAAYHPFGVEQRAVAGLVLAALRR
jgi:lysophospholipase L1-like esterase